MRVLLVALQPLIVVYQSVFLALAQVWANKLRSILTTTGIVIGVASVTAVIAALTGLKSNVLSEFESFGTNKIFINPHRPQTGPLKNAFYQQIYFTRNLFEGILEHTPSVRAITRVMRVGVTVRREDKTLEDVDASGIDASWHSIEGRSVTLGRAFSLIDNEVGRPVCLINSKTQESLALPRDPTGEAIFLEGQRFTIVGLVEDAPQSAMFRGNSGDSEVFVPFDAAIRLAKTTFPIYTVTAAAKSPAVSDEARAELTFALRQRRGIAPGDPDTFRIDAVEKFVQQFNSLASAITLVATGIVGVSLLVGGVGIMNIMLVSVSERTREIGLRKAVGARPTTILLQFLVEAVTLCLMGGLLGVAGGQGLTAILKMIPNAQLGRAVIPGWAIALSFGFAAVVGLVFGMFPAIKASRLDPIDALRHE